MRWHQHHYAFIKESGEQPARGGSAGSSKADNSTEYSVCDVQRCVQRICQQKGSAPVVCIALQVHSMNTAGHSSKAAGHLGQLAWWAGAAAPPPAARLAAPAAWRKQQPHRSVPFMQRRGVGVIRRGCQELHHMLRYNSRNAQGQTPFECAQGQHATKGSHLLHGVLLVGGALSTATHALLTPGCTTRAHTQSACLCCVEYSM